MQIHDSTRVICSKQAAMVIRLIFQANANPLHPPDPRETAELSCFALEVEGHDTEWVVVDARTSSEGRIDKLLLKQKLGDPRDRRYIVVRRPYGSINEAFSSIVRFEGPEDLELSEHQHVFQYHHH